MDVEAKAVLKRAGKMYGWATAGCAGVELELRLQLSGCLLYAFFDLNGYFGLKNSIGCCPVASKGFNSR